MQYWRQAQLRADSPPLQPLCALETSSATGRQAIWPPETLELFFWRIEDRRLKHQRRNGEQEQLQVEYQALFFGIYGVGGDPPVIRAVAAYQLPQPGDPRPNGTVAPKTMTVERNLCGRDRPRPDDAHLPTEHIEELRELIEAGLAQKVPDGR